MKVITVAGARPNFVKIAPLLHGFNSRNAESEKAGRKDRIESVLVHSGQHYDSSMSDVFFRDLNIPPPDINLGIGSGSHAQQTGKAMIAFEMVFEAQKPDVIVVVGDVNTTLAAALVAAKLRIPLAHVEAGLRSYDRSMPEEINRILTDAVADFLFITEKDAEINLLKEGIAPEKIFFAGNVMIDSLLKLTKRTEESKVLHAAGLQKRNYAVITLHRPETVDDPAALASVLQILSTLQTQIPVVFPVHPRTRARLDALPDEKNQKDLKGVRLLDPLGYIEFVTLMKFARFVITDSGGIQEETTALGIPCITLRKTTERPVTVTDGTNVVAGNDPAVVLQYCEKAVRGEWKAGSMPPLWDGKAGERIVRILCERFLTSSEAPQR